MVKLLSYDFEIEYKPSRSNFMADVLSQHDEEGEVVAGLKSQWTNWSLIQQVVENDLTLAVTI